MTIVAIMTQPARAPYCRAYLEQATFNKAIVLVGESAVFDLTSLPAGVEVRVVTNRSIYRSPFNRLWDRTRRRFANWSRSGSAVGNLLGRVGRSTERSIRRFRRERPRHAQTGEEQNLLPGSKRRDPILTELRSLSLGEAPTRVVVFDVFDLPAALEFAEEAFVEVLVR